MRTKKAMRCQWSQLMSRESGMMLEVNAYVSNFLLIPDQIYKHAKVVSVHTRYIKSSDQLTSLFSACRP